jgi:serine/threonine protein kinase
MLLVFLYNLIVEVQSIWRISQQGQFAFKGGPGMADRVGQQFGNYRLIHMLGEGAFAEVYLGEHIYLGTQAAIKVLHTQLTSDDTEKFRAEARTIAHLVHPHIVRVLEFGVEDKTPFLVMDFAPHSTLRQRHPRGVPLPPGAVVSYVKQVADALQYAHDEKLIHRDVKPENMLVGRRGEILLSDFGIALVAQSSRYQSTQDMAGTMAYMAPEQIQGKPRPASDQYSLGIVVYEWLSGDRPFHGSFTEIVGQHLSVPPPPLYGRIPVVSPDTEQVVMTALAKDPRQRFASVQAFATALEQAGQSDVATIVKFLPPAEQPPRMTTPPGRQPLSTVGNTPANPLPELPVEAAPRSQPPPSTVGALPPGGQQWPVQAGQMTGFSRPPQPKRGLRIGFIIGALLLVVALIGASFIFFTLNRPGTGTNPGSAGSGTNGSPTTRGSMTPLTSPATTTITLPNDLISPGTLTIGSDTTYPPQEYIDTATNQPAGFDIDLITAMAQRMGLQAKIIRTNFNTILDDLLAKHFDVVISAVSVTPERQSRVDFIPYFSAGESLLVQKGNPHNIRSTVDLCGLPVGVQTGTIEQIDLQTANKDCTNRGKPAIKLTVLQDQTAVVQLLANSRVVATYQDSPVTDYYIKLNPGQFEVGGSVIGAGPEGIVIRKGDTSMFHAVKAAFDQIKANGTYHSLILKWGLTNEEISMVDRRFTIA